MIDVDKAFATVEKLADWSQLRSFAEVTAIAPTSLGLYMFSSQKRTIYVGVGAPETVAVRRNQLAFAVVSAYISVAALLDLGMPSSTRPLCRRSSLSCPRPCRPISYPCQMMLAES